MPVVKLTYFNIRGRAEPVRIMFEMAGVKYEDIRVSREDFETLKPTLPFGQLPVLQVDELILPQSRAIYGFVAAQHGFLPADNVGRAQVDVVIETIGDSDFDVGKWFFEKDEVKKGELKKHIDDVVFPKMLGHLEKLLSKNKEGKGWFVGDKVTLADVIVFTTVYGGIPSVSLGKPGSYDLSKYPLLQGFVDRFKALPKVAAWLEKRPDTMF